MTTGSKYPSRFLDAEEVLRAYDQVVELYPYIPPLSHWRAWEFAAYQHFCIDRRVLDLGCGDGQYFSLLWPKIVDVIGVDMNPEVAELGRRSGVYRTVHTAPGHRIPEPDASFDHVFANCSLEHMNQLDAVLAEVFRCLKPGGTLLCSVVTDRFIQWSTLPNLVEMGGFDHAAKMIRDEFIAYHNLANPLSIESWATHFKHAGLHVEEYIPILPIYNSSIFLLMDNLWHMKCAERGEMGEIFFPFLSSNPRFPVAFRKVLAGLLEMEIKQQECSGAVFLVRKLRQ